MDMHSAFLDDIIAHYDDDAPRLIYADWLDDHGDGERAEFIRVQCRLAQMKSGEPEYESLKEREGELLRRNELDWVRPWKGQRNSTWFRRGFLDAVYFRVMPTVPLAMLASTIHPRLSLATTLWFPDSKYTPQLVSMVGQARLRCLRRLTCSNGRAGADLVTAFVSWPAEMALAELTLAGCKITPSNLCSLASAPWLTSLRFLDLRFNPFDLEALCSFLSHSSLPRLETLHHSGTYEPGFGTEGDSLARVATLLFDRVPALREYRLHRSAVGVAGVNALIDSGVLARLDRLELSLTEIRDLGATMLADALGAGQMKALWLRQNGITNVGVRALAGSPMLSNVVELDFSWNPLDAASVRLIAESPYLNKVSLLRIGSMASYAATFAEPLLDPGVLPSLRELTVDESICTPNLAERFAARGVTLTHYGQ